MALYDLYLIGSNCRSETDAIRNAILRCLNSAGVAESDVEIYVGPKQKGDYLDGKRPVVAVCFKDTSSYDMKILCEFLRRRVPIIPLCRKDESYTDFPDKLQGLNGLNYSKETDKCDRIASAMLDAIGLLREQRRIFVSYRRVEATEVAVQLFDYLSASGFNVFLDTHSISPGVDVQDSLWHQLCDSDVVVMLDTPNYFGSRWTTEEFGRAKSTQIHILRLVWPDHKPTEFTNLSQTIKLSTEDLPNGRLTVDMLNTVVTVSQNLRAKSIASRHTMISGKLVTGVNGAGGRVVGVGAFRAIAVSFPSNSESNSITFWVYPIVGVPTAHVMNNIATRAQDAQHEKPFLMFDDFGISKTWLEHLDWLNARVQEVDFMKASTAASELKRRMNEI